MRAFPSAASRLSLSPPKTQSSSSSLLLSKQTNAQLNYLNVKMTSTSSTTMRPTMMASCVVLPLRLMTSAI